MLAVLVNVVELVCTAGLPALYERWLKLLSGVAIAVLGLLLLCAPPALVW